MQKCFNDRLEAGSRVRSNSSVRAPVFRSAVGVPGRTRTWCSSDVRLMKRRKSSPPEDTATEESTPVRQSVAHVRLSLRPRMVSPAGAGTACQQRMCFRKKRSFNSNGCSKIMQELNENTFVSLEEFQQSADSGHSWSHVRVFPHLSPEILHQLWAGTRRTRLFTATPTKHKQNGKLENVTLPSSFILTPQHSVKAFL